MTSRHSFGLSFLFQVPSLVGLFLGFVYSSAFAAVVSGTYTGDGTAGRAVNIGFQPDFVLIQRADTGMTMQVRTAGMSESKDVALSTNNTNRITGLTSTGFTVSNDGTTVTPITNVNSSGVAYEYLAISQVAGEIKVGSYAGDGTDNRSITGVGFQPDLVWTMRLGQPSAWRTNTMVGDVTTTWTTVTFADGIQALQADGFQVGTEVRVNTSGSTYWYIACKKVAGKFNTGTYAGTGATRSITGVGFRPEGLFIKRENSTVSPGIKWASSGVSTSSFLSVLQAVQSIDIINSLDTDGFSLGTTGTRVNGLGFNYHWFAFAPVAPPPPPPVVTNVTSSTADGAYRATQSVSIQVTFDSSVTVTGTPTLALNSGGSASYSTGSGSNSLTFNYTIGAGQNIADLDYSSTSALALSGGTINATTGGTASTLTLPVPGGVGSLGANKAIVIDTTAPTIGISAPSVSSITAGTGSVTYTVTYADTNFNASTLSTGNIALNNTGTASGTVGVSGSGLTRTVTISSITGVGTLGITIAAGTASDTAGNTAPAAGPSATFTVLGVPEINVQGNSTSIASGDATPSSTDHTDFGSQSVTSGTIVRTFTIQNTGTANLTLSTPTFSGTNAADFSVTANPTSPVAPAGSTTFQVTFNPSALGTRLATVTISNNDSDEGTYTFTIMGTGVDPEINVQGNGNSIASGDATPSSTDHTDFGSQSVTSGTIVRTFTIQNTGTANLTLSTPTFSGTNAADFSVTANPTSPVAPAGSTTFQVTFNPSGLGTRIATVSISNNDGDEGTYTFTIMGTGVDPEINVQGNGNSIASGDATPSSTDHTDFGSQSVTSGTIVRTFTIQNTGNANLTVNTPTLSGTNAADFSVTANPTSPVVPAGSTTFQVTFDPSASGTRSATINITNNDGDEGTYTFAIQGTGLPAPTISSVNPTTGPTTGGTSVVITGTDFIGATTVTFDGITTSFTVDSATQITATTPPHVSGPVSVIVTTPGGANAANSLFTYAAPTLSGVSPSSGPAAGGTSVTISGANFTGASAVTFGGNPATSVVVVNDSTITCTTPAHASGPVSVMVTAGGQSNGVNTAFTYNAASDIPVSLTSGTLNLNASSSTGAADTRLRFVTGPGGPFLEIYDAGRTVGAPAGGTQVDSHTVLIPLSSVTNLTLTGSSQADKFTIDFSNGDPLPGGAINVIGGLPATPGSGDSLVITGGTFSDGEYGPGSNGDGYVDVDGKIINFTGLEPVDFSGSTFTTFTVNVDPGSSYVGTVTTTISAVDGGVNTNFDFGASGLESVKVGAVTGTLTVNGDNAENDYFLLQNLGTAMTGHFVLDGLGGSADVVDINNTTFTVSGTGKNFSAKADFIGFGRSGAQIGTLVCSGNVTLESDGDSTLTPVLWGTGGVYGTTRPAYFSNQNALTGERGSVAVGGVISKVSGADATCTIKAKSVVSLPLLGQIVSTSNKLHVVLHADTDSTNGGAVSLTQQNIIRSNGGDITMGGGTNPVTQPAIGTTANANNLNFGVLINASEVTSAGGNISMRGTGRAVANGVGVNIQAGQLLAESAVNSGSGSLTIVGTGGGSFSGAAGVRLSGVANGSAPLDGAAFYRARLLTSSGAVNITGTAPGGNNPGITMLNWSEIVSSGAAVHSITGTGAGTGVGVNLSPAASVTTHLGSMTSTASITSAGGSITLIADKMNLNGGAGTESISAVNGSVRLMPRTGGVVVNLGSSIDTTASTLELSAAELDNITAGSIEVADFGLFPITVSAVIAPLNFRTLFLLSNTTFAATGGFASDVTSSSVFEQLVVFGTVSITSGATLTMSSAGGYIWNGTDTFRVIDNDAGDAITGTFTGPTLTTFLGSALTAQQTYTGGTGNDLVFFGPPSSNADLSALALSSGTLEPVFGAATTAYTASVSNATSSLTVTATRAQANATLQVQVNGGGFNLLTSATPSGALGLSVGSNTIDVKVTAQDGTTIKMYTITVTRRSILQDWRFDFFSGDFSGSGNMANGLDFDSDGKSNLLEFAFGTDPTSGSSGPPDLTMSGTYAAAVFGTTGQPIVSREVIANGVDFRAVFIRRADHAAAGLTYTPEFSADNFTTFTPGGTAPTVLATSGSFELVSVPYPHFLPSGKKARFFRISVSITP